MPAHFPVALPPVHEECRTFARAHGFAHFLFVAYVPAGTVPTAPMIVTDYPVAWVEVYDLNGFVRIDPVLRRAMSGVEPFGWEVFDRCASETALFWSQAARHALDHGLSVPLHGPHGAFGLLSLAGNDAPSEPTERRALFACAHSLALKHFESALSALRPEAEVEHLTQRQNQALDLVARGMTIRSVADRLHVHHRTVENLLAHACVRLGVRTREQAIARAVELGVIGPAWPETAFRGSIVIRDDLNTEQVVT